MSFSTLDKEKKQQVVLGVLMVLTVLFVGMNLLVKPAMEELEKARKVVNELEPKVRTGESLARSDVLTRQDLQKYAKRILDAERQFLPPAESRFTWALQQITDITHSMGLASKVEELKQPRFRSSAQPFAVYRDKVPMWVPYAVDVRLQASYDEVKTLVSRIQDGNPYASVSQLGIYASDTGQFEKHTVTLIVEWPIFRDRSDVAILRNLAGDS